MYPELERHEPQHRQIADQLEARITAGEPGFRPGDKLPAVRTMARELGVSAATVQHAYELLKSSRLVVADRQHGTRVAPPRNTLSPDARLAVGQYPAGEHVEVRSAALVPATGDYAYVRGVLGLSTGLRALRVIRREEIISDASGPYILRVTWVPQQYGPYAPELTEAAPLPDPAGAAHLVAARLDIPITWGDSSREARRAKDDGREDLLFGAGRHILAETWVLGSGERTLEYGEQCVAENRVVKTRLVVS